MSLFLLMILGQDVCTEFRGTAHIFTLQDQSQTQIVMCNIGREWIAAETMLEEKKGVHTLAANHFLSDVPRQTYSTPDGTLIQPSYGFCTRQLQASSLRSFDTDHNEFGICKLQDGSMIGDWTLYRGKKNARTTGIAEELARLRSTTTGTIVR